MSRRLLVYKDGQETVHQEHPFMGCNTGSAQRKALIDDATATAMIEKGLAQPCPHCMMKFG